ncbi:MAG: hypothetical protein ABJL57_08890, partial [Hyphomonas sp.]
MRYLLQCSMSFKFLPCYAAPTSRLKGLCAELLEVIMLTRTITIGLLSFLTLIDLFGSQAILPQLTEFYGTDPASMGLAVNASTFGMAAAGLVVALLSRHIDRVKGIWISLTVLAVPTTLLGFVDDLALFSWL